MRKYFSVFIFCFTVGTGYAFSDPGDLPPPPPPAPGIPPPGLPIDMGLTALLASGIGLGILFLKKKKE